MPTAFNQAIRSLRRSPAFALTVIVTLGIGIGLNAAIFTVVDNVLLRPLGYHDADRIVALRTHFDNENRSIPRLGGPDYDDLVRDIHGLESTAYYGNEPDGISVAGKSLYTAVAEVSPRFMQVMGVQPIAGRLFNPDDQQGQNAIVSASFARDYLSSAAVGKTLSHEGAVYTVIGVLPDGFTFPARTEVWVERPAAQPFSSRSSYNYRVVGKRRAGVSEAQLDAELATFTAHLKQAYEENRYKTIEAVSLQEQLTGRIRPTLNLLMGSVLVILLIVCANVTHLQLVRATRELRAVSIRTALGASRSALARRALTETILLALAGTALALLLAVPALRLLVRIAPPATPRLAEIRLNLDVFAFSFLITFALMLVTAMLPLWRSWHVDPATVLRADASRGTESRGTLRLRSGFIVVEVALTLTLSVAAILLSRQLIAQSHQDLGFQPDSLLTLDSHAISATPTPLLKDKSPAALAAYQAQSASLDAANLSRLDALLASSAAVPGVTSVAAITGAPMGFGGSDANYAVKGKSDFGSLDLPNADIRPITPGAFATLGIPVLHGRAFTPEDRATSPGVVVINQELARQSFPGQDPIGQQIKVGYDFAVPAWATIVGVVGDIRGSSPAEPARATMYLAIAQHPRTAADMQILVRTALPPDAMKDTLQRTLLRSHPEVAIDASTMVRNIADVQQGDSFRTILFTLFAAVSILLAAIGMYGVTAYTVAQRRFEFGLRIALGATRTQLLTMVLRSALAVSLLGIALGALLSLALQKTLASVIGKLPVFDLTAYALAACTVLAIALLATLLPARRAAGVDPMTVLRSE